MSSQAFRWLQERVVFGRRTKRLARRLLMSPLLVDSSPYRWLYGRRMDREMESLALRPRFIRIETTNRCRADCTFCPHRQMRRPEGEMTADLYARIVSQARVMGVERLSLHGFGEPFLDRQFIDRIRIAKAAGIRQVSTNTNGACLHGALIEGCLAAGLDEIYISLDAATEETYRSIRPGLSFPRVEENIRMLLAARARQGKNSLKVYLSFVEYHDNKHEVFPFYERWRHQVDGISFSFLHNWGNRIDSGAASGPRRDPCRHLWAGLDINVTGGVPLCCYDCETETPLGDLSRQTLAEVWHGDVLAGYREAHRRRDYGSIPLCRGCNANDHHKNPWWLHT